MTRSRRLGFGFQARRLLPFCAPAPGACRGALVAVWPWACRTVVLAAPLLLTAGLRQARTASGINGRRQGQAAVGITFDHLFAPGPVLDQPQEPPERCEEDNERRVVVEAKATDLVHLIDPQRLDPEAPQRV